MEDAADVYVHCENGLFPLTISFKVQVVSSDYSDTVRLFDHLLGKVLGKSVMDSRQVCNNNWYEST